MEYRWERGCNQLSSKPNFLLHVATFLQDLWTKSGLIWSHPTRATNTKLVDNEEYHVFTTTWLVIDVLQTCKKCASITNHRKTTSKYCDPFTFSIFNPFGLHKNHISSLLLCYMLTYGHLGQQLCVKLYRSSPIVRPWIPQPFAIETKVFKTKSAHYPLVLQRPCFKLHRPMHSIKSPHHM
jgi:hypothetical protein